MKNNQNIRGRRSGGGNQPVSAPPISGTQLSPSGSRHAFTLIELLVVISIIAVLAAFTIPVYKTVARKKILDRTRGEMEQIETAIDSYKTAYGFYPPSNNSNPKYDLANPASWNNALYTPLYFELLGTTNNNGTYYTLDGSASILVSALAATATSPLGVSGFINCSKSGGGEDAPAARNFLPGLTPKRIGLGITNNIDPAHPVALLLAAVGGPDPSYQPLGPGLNPWRYVSPGINNPNSYDLWVQLVISGRTNLICNWSKNVQLNSPLP